METTREKTYLAGAAIAAGLAYWFIRRTQTSQRAQVKLARGSEPLYFDYNATTPIHPEVALAMEPYIKTHFGNPSSRHAYGHAAKQAVGLARDQIASLIGATSEEIFFTSGATESINWALKGAAIAQRKAHGGANHIIISCVEHVVVLEVCRYLEREGFRVTILPVDSTGRVQLSDLKNALTFETVLVSIMTANNETGAVNDIQELVKASKAVNPDILFHTDCSQGLGKIPVSVAESGVDLLTIAGHKIYAPKGVGALYIREGTLALEPLLHGASCQESGRRGGTENVIFIAGLGKACQIIQRDGKAIMQHFRTCRDQLQASISKRLQEATNEPVSSLLVVNGHPDHRLTNTLSISFSDITACALLANIEHKIAASAGAACHSGKITVSNVLRAMKLDPKFAPGTLRLSVGMYTTIEEVEACAAIVAKAVAELRVVKA